MKRHGHLECLVTDKLRSCAAPLKGLGMQDKRITDRWESNPAENSHQPFRRRERAMLRFRRTHSLQEFASVPGSVRNHVGANRRLTDRTTYKQTRTSPPAEWRGLCADESKAHLPS